MEIVIRGMSVLSSAGAGAIGLCEQSLNDVSFLTKFDLRKLETEISAFEKGPHELTRIQKLILLAFLRASRSAGLTEDSIASNQTAIFLGNSYGLEEFKSGFFSLYKKSDPALTSPTLFPFTTANALAAWLAIQTGAKGPNTTFVNGSNSSAEAILAACDALSNDECETAFVGGVNLLDKDLNNEFCVSGFRNECVAMVVLQRFNKETCSSNQSTFCITNWQREKLSNEELKKIKYERSILSISEKEQNLQANEIIHLGNNLGDQVFSYNKDEIDINARHRVFSYSDVVGNVFDASGALGVALSVECLAAEQNGRCSFFDTKSDRIFYSNVDSTGTTISMLISNQTIPLTIDCHVEKSARI